MWKCRMRRLQNATDADADETNNHKPSSGVYCVGAVPYIVASASAVVKPADMRMLELSVRWQSLVSLKPSPQVRRRKSSHRSRVVLVRLNTAYNRPSNCSASATEITPEMYRSPSSRNQWRDTRCFVSLNEVVTIIGAVTWVTGMTYLPNRLETLAPAMFRSPEFWDSSISRLLENASI